MAKNDKSTAIPRLRFPEFFDEWRESSLNTVVNEFRANSTVQDEHEVLTSARRGLMRQVDYYGEGRITERDNVGFNIIPADYLTYRSRTDDGRFYFNHNDLGITGIISIYYPVFHSIDGSNVFLANLLNRFSAEIGTHSVGTSQRVLPISKLLKIRLPIPVAAEQQKIADCLTSLDEVVATQGRKAEALKAYKKGLMQQLFPREGESLPRRRFPEFQKAEAWTEKTIGQISGSIIAGGTPSTSKKSYWNGDVRWMNSGELNLKKVYEVDGRITTEGLKTSSTKLIPRGCVLIGLAGQGKTRGTVAMNMVELCTNQSIAAIFPNKSVFESDFLYHNLDSRYDELRKLSANGEGRGGLNLQIIKSLKINLPKRAEQQKIANCLTALDAQIIAESKKFDTLKTHKKGLMQQLFPTSERSQT